VAEMDERWGEETKAVWKFLEVCYRKGLLDEIFSFANIFMDPHINPMDMMGEAEETLSKFDFDSLDATLKGNLVPLMNALSDEEVVEGLKYLLQTVRPFCEIAVAQAGGDVGEAKRRAKLMGKSLKTVGMLLAPVLLAKALPVIQLIIASAAPDSKK
jgi:hypothetical protein